MNKQNFLSGIQHLIEEGKRIETNFKNNVGDTLDPKDKVDYSLWIKECEKYLSSSIDDPKGIMVKEFSKNIGDHDLIFSESLEKYYTLKEVANKLYLLKCYDRMIGVCDEISNQDKRDQISRSEFGVEETKILLLEKLYDLYDDRYYPGLLLLSLIGVQKKSKGEHRDLIAYLLKQGLVSRIEDNLYRIKITLKGRVDVEKKRKSKLKIDIKGVAKSQKEVDGRIDEVIEKLIVLGYGQEIIFDEINELKELYGKLNKKNWVEVIKGKLIGLAVSKLLDENAIKFVYEKLTQNTLRLQ